MNKYVFMVFGFFIWLHFKLIIVLVFPYFYLNLSIQIIFNFFMLIQVLSEYIITVCYILEKYVYGLVLIREQILRLLRVLS